MASLEDVIKFQGKKLSETTGSNDTNILVDAINRLHTIENELLLHPMGSVNFSGNGVYFIDSYPKEVADKISTLLDGMNLWV
ncbi:MAG: hypothetical protein WBB20_13740 [Chitinophagaceae bacterium]|jgi:hypothetical protein|nr:hypothetical protein [Chitinophagaceae bacterium]